MDRRIYFLEGKIFGGLTVISYLNKKYLCKCECGKELYILGTDLRNGKYVSCGCRRKITDKFYDKRFLNRFFRYIQIVESGCWEWIGTKTREGYGHVSYKGKIRKATRVLWELKIGPIPEKTLLCHKCDNPKCVNPEHLFLGTNLDNSRDCMSKKRFNARVGENHPRSKLSEDDVKEIKRLLKQMVPSMKIAKQFGVGNTTIFHIKQLRNWKHVEI